MTDSRHTRAGILVAIAAASFIVMLSALPGWAQDGDKVESERWTARFDDPQVNAGTKTVGNTSRFIGSGTFRFEGIVEADPRILASVTVTGTGSTSSGSCTPEVTGSKTDRSEDRFDFRVVSPCNQSVALVVSAKSTTFSLPDPLTPAAESASMATRLTFAVPPKPVTSVAATVADIDARDVNITWATPEGSEPDTTYVVQRKSPESDEWESVPTNVEDDEDQQSSTDTVEDIGVYGYRVVAERPLVDPVASVPVDVGVGIAPTTTTTIPDGTSPPVTQPGSTAPINRGGSTQVGNRGVSTHTTVTVDQNTRAPVTTIDTGFEETLDYHLDDEEPGELAAEGQSILATEDEASIIGPGAIGAAAMVMVGWASHVIYFRRLASQF